MKYMKIAFCLFNYFPHGGLQRDFLHIAKLCQQRGHDIHVYTMSWQGDQPVDFNIHLISLNNLSNDRRAILFAERVHLLLKSQPKTLIFGFNKMPGLHIYYAADSCFKEKVYHNHSWLYRLLPRYKNFMHLEKSVFAVGKKTHILSLCTKQQIEYTHHYQTEIERFTLLPPTINKDRLYQKDSSVRRQQLRKQYHLSSQHKFILFIGSRFKTKGLDRAIKALAALPDTLRTQTHLFIIGNDQPGRYYKLCKKLHLAKQVHFLGGRFDVPDFLAAADLLIHPARFENTGTVLLEAMAAGLPVLSVAICGYADYILKAKAGCILSSPFKQESFNLMLATMLTQLNQQSWSKNALHFIENTDLFSMPIKVVELMEKLRHDVLCTPRIKNLFHRK